MNMPCFCCFLCCRQHPYSTVYPGESAGFTFFTLDGRSQMQGLRPVPAGPCLPWDRDAGSPSARLPSATEGPVRVVAQGRHCPVPCHTDPVRVVAQGVHRPGPAPTDPVPASLPADADLRARDRRMDNRPEPDHSRPTVYPAHRCSTATGWPAGDRAGRSRRGPGRFHRPGLQLRTVRSWMTVALVSPGPFPILGPPVPVPGNPGLCTGPGPGGHLHGRSFPAAPSSPGPGPLHGPSVPVPVTWSVYRVRAR